MSTGVPDLLLPSGAPDPKMLRKHVRKIVRGGDLSELTNKVVRTRLEAIFACPLKEHKETINELILKALAEVQEGAGDRKEIRAKEMSKFPAASKENSNQAHGHLKATARRPNETKPHAMKPQASPSEAKEEARLRELIRQAKLTSRTRFKGAATMPPEVRSCESTIS